MTGIRSFHAAFTRRSKISKFDMKMRHSVLYSVIEETEEPIKIHVGRAFQEVLLPRVLEVVGSFCWIS